MIALCYIFIIVAYATVFYYTTAEIYDFVIMVLHAVYWLTLLFTANTLFTVIFLIEILTTLIIFLIVTATFSTTYALNNLNMSHHLYFSQTTPYFFILTILYFFWLSLFASLLFYFFCIIFFLYFFTFDWFLFEYLFIYLITIFSKIEIILIAVTWFGILFSIFLKLGLAPLYIWKPVFFKGLSIYVLFFYIICYYFFILFYFMYLFLYYLQELFFTYLFINIFFLLSGFTLLLMILCEAYYLKTFLALSSILNTLFVFLSLNSINTEMVFFYI